jgi:hypothetical protein
MLYADHVVQAEQLAAATLGHVGTIDIEIQTLACGLFHVLYHSCHVTVAGYVVRL